MIYTPDNSNDNNNNDNNDNEAARAAAVFFPITLSVCRASGSDPAKGNHTTNNDDDK